VPKIVFVQREIEDKLGPMILTAYLKAQSLDAEIVIDPRKRIDDLKRLNPEFIGISFCSPSVEWALSTCRFLKQHLPASLTVLGGPHPTFFPEIVDQPGVDLVCVGEGERAVFQLLTAYDGSLSSILHVPNFWVKNGSSVVKNPVRPLLTEEELSALPFCDRSHYAKYPLLRKNHHKKIWTSRGCPYNCRYCFNHAYKEIYKGQGKMIRQRSVDSALAELRELKTIGWKALEIIDDQFILSRDWLFDFCQRYARDIGLPFTCSSTAKQLTPDIVAALKAAGCKTVYFGIESGVERIRRKVYNKPISDEDIFNAADALHRHKMPFLTFNIVGFADETLEDIYATVKINQRIRPTYPWCSILQPYPGTRIAEYFPKDDKADFSTRQFPYSFFQTSPVHDPVKRKTFSNAQKLFAYSVKHGIGFDRFVRMTTRPSLGADRLYPLAFYWYYGNSLRQRYGMSWPALFQYWRYTRG
jgi:anaerobic magnesium-protoporphyrin IX monomethyl ester cyclase